MNNPVDQRLLNGSLAGLAIVLAVVSLLSGQVGLPLLSAIADVWHGRPTPSALILFDIRLPRAILGLVIGATLGLCGAAMQGLLRNPLADPGVMGVSSLASFGAVLAFYSGLSAQFALALPIGGVVGALVAVLLLYGLAGRNSSVLTLLLAGTAVSTLGGALTALALSLSPNPYAAFEIIFWLLGSLADRSFEHVWIATPLMLIGWALLLTAGPALDALTLGEETAQSLGFNLRSLRLRLILGTGLAVGAAVAVSGAIGFVGLVVPHVLRPLVGHQPSRLLLPSAFGGACLVLAADIAVRSLATGPELKLGVLTALVGAPFFLVLVVRLRREEV